MLYVKKFLNFRQLDAAEEITLGNGYSVDALGIGMIECESFRSKMAKMKVV